MRNFLPVFLFAIVLTSFFSSCSIEKRVYMPGYNVQWNSKSKTLKPVNEDRNFVSSENLNSHPAVADVVFISNEVIAIEEVATDDLLVSNSDEILPVKKESLLQKFNKKMDSESVNFIASDVDVKKVNAKVNLIAKFYPLFAKKKSAANTSKSDRGTSQLLALLLCFFFGWIGVHRFYLGYVGIGFLQLLTFGLFGIWTLIDLVRIIIGDLQPKYGRYTDTF